MVQLQILEQQAHLFFWLVLFILKQVQIITVKSFLVALREQTLFILEMFYFVTIGFLRDTASQWEDIGSIYYYPWTKVFQIHI